MLHIQHFYLCMLTAFYLLFFHILILMFLWSYWQTVYTNLMPVPDKVMLYKKEFNDYILKINKMIICHIL